HARKLVGAAGFEPTTTSPPDWCATRLRHAPTNPESSTRAGRGLSPRSTIATGRHARLDAMDLRGPARWMAVPLVVAVLVAACGAEVTSSRPLPPLPGFIPPGATRGPGESLDCDRLLSAADLAAATGTEVRARGSNKISCFW